MVGEAFIVICICTCRRPDGLQNLLLELEKIDYEGACAVVVIDNDEQIQGVKVCNTLTDYRWPLSCYVEKNAGIAYARNAAVRAALQLEPQFIAMLDDDEWPSRQWLTELSS